MSKDTILFFFPSLKGGGAERNLINIANYINNKEGQKIVILVQNEKGPLKKKISDNIEFYSLEKERMILSVGKLLKILHILKPNYIVSTLTQANLILLFIKPFLFFNSRIIVRVESILSKMIEDEKEKHFFFKFASSLIGSLFPRADRIIAISDGVKKDLEENFGISGNKITTIFNPAFPDRIEDMLEENVQHPWFIKKEVPLVISIGRLAEEKGFDLLIRSFKKVTKNLSCKLVILGEGPERQNIQNLIDILELSDDIWLPGFIENPYKYLARADLYVLSSRYEGFGNVLVEAMACNLKIVATNCPSGPIEILRNGKYGSLVPMENVDELAATIEKKLKETDINVEYDKDWINQFRLENIAKKYLLTIKN